ncbi:GNAT family N-acetyltransferase [Flavobacterium magnum]|uniref:GNAT family N-acetyltransferase n=1 Tax=Flavobacterium magnum TaxID=2162713 RepID=A0A2S0RFX3_9FLAO|nr:GNAT family N-acetyltransferase [Flavobacterium magnum]AWA30128.1 GNAT family N-acetyltransferase [Flavobacterium magnum]
MIHYVKTDSENPDFIALVRLLDADLAIRDGEDHAFYDQFNKIATLKNVVVAYDNDVAVGCGAFKEYTPELAEVKRMFVPENRRGEGIASGILAVLEAWILQSGYRGCILETGIKQPEAIALYRKNGYRVIPNFGQYEGIENSVCFEKVF